MPHLELMRLISGLMTCLFSIRSGSEIILPDMVLHQNKKLQKTQTRCKKTIGKLYINVFANFHY